MKEFRFFISSTFLDMQQERDVIRNEVLPEIETFVKPYHAHVSIVDLRWGISTDLNNDNDDSSFLIYRTCFEEIDQSKPFFIGLVGNRYGWIPDLSEFQNDLDDRYKKYLGKSITEAEILYALDSFKKEGSFIFAFRKSIRGSLDNDDELRYISNDEEDQKHLSKLKSIIESHNKDSVFMYEPTICNGVLELSDFRDELITLIKKEILKKLNVEVIDNPLDDLISLHKSIIENNHQFFSGREESFDYIDKQGKIINAFY